MPTVYRLTHRSNPNDIDTEKLIGFISSLEKCNSIIQHYITIQGFKDYPKQFKIKKYWVSNKLYVDKTVYYVQYYYDETNWIKKKDKVIYINIGTYANKKIAFKIKCLSSKMLLFFLKRGDVVCEQYTLDNCEWAEGFDIVYT